mmetsp:Transcript_41911/g.118632  ORF Transcript_41911/g.118632 Transcript_41911/m.118632 type:complete len:213 (-) Transcript_41911:910-1548(-)
MAGHRHAGGGRQQRRSQRLAGGCRAGDCRRRGQRHAGGLRATCRVPVGGVGARAPRALGGALGLGRPARGVDRGGGEQWHPRPTMAPGDTVAGARLGQGGCGGLQGVRGPGRRDRLRRRHGVLRSLRRRRAHGHLQVVRLASGGGGRRPALLALAGRRRCVCSARGRGLAGGGSGVAEAGAVAQRSRSAFGGRRVRSVRPRRPGDDRELVGH